jgi:3-deoxy-D-manno-octulosonic acid kinase
LPDTQSLAALLDLGHQEEPVWEAIGRVLRRFHDEGVDHADLNAHNILLNNRGEVFVVDFDRGEIRIKGSWQETNLNRLERSLRKLATHRGGAFPAVGWRALRLAYDH